VQYINCSTVLNFWPRILCSIVYLIANIGYCIVCTH